MRALTALAFVFFAGWVAARATEPLPAHAAPGPADFTDVIAQAEPSVVHITTRLRGNRKPRSRDDAVGSGFVVDAAGYVVTNRHVVSGAEAVFVTIPGRGTHPARVEGFDEATDMALLRVGVSGLRPIAIGDPSSLRPGQWVVAAGSPFRLAYSWSAGIVSGLARSGVGVNPKGYESFIQTDAAANLGNSGGPLLDTTGRVVGMVTATLSRSGGFQGITLAVPIDVVMNSVRRFRGGTARPTLGLRVRPLRSHLGSGLQITRFDPGSPAEAAGLRVGDVVLSVNGTPVPSAAALQRVVWAERAGTPVTIVYHRNGARGEMVVTLR